MSEPKAVKGSGLYLRKDSNDEATYMLCGHGCAVKLYGYINGKKPVELTHDPAFNVEYEKDKVKVAWLRKDLSVLPVTLPATCPTATTAPAPNLV